MTGLQELALALLAEMVEAGAVTAPRYDRARAQFDVIRAKMDHLISVEATTSASKLQTATIGLRVATWWLAGVTFLLGLVEFLGHRSN